MAASSPKSLHLIPILILFIHFKLFIVILLTFIIALLIAFIIFFIILTVVFHYLLFLAPQCFRLLTIFIHVPYLDIVVFEVLLKWDKFFGVNS